MRRKRRRLALWQGWYRCYSTGSTGIACDDTTHRFFYICLPIYTYVHKNMLDAYVYIMVAYGKVRALNRRLSRATLAKMRVALLSADFGLRHLLLLLGIVLLHLPDNLMAEPCPAENCLSAEKCESSWAGAVCQDSNLQCCSIVKKENRNHCRHHGGECMDRCSSVLQRQADNCPGQLCCVLV